MKGKFNDTSAVRRFSGTIVPWLKWRGSCETRIRAKKSNSDREKSSTTDGAYTQHSVGRCPVVIGDIESMPTLTVQ